MIEFILFLSAPFVGWYLCKERFPKLSNIFGIALIAETIFLTYVFSR